METKLKLKGKIYTLQEVECAEMAGGICTIYISTKENPETVELTVDKDTLVSFIEKEEINWVIEDYSDYSGEHVQKAYKLDAETYLYDNLSLVAELYVNNY